MQKKVIILVVALAVVAGLAYYLNLQSKKSTTEEPVESVATEASSSSEGTSVLPDGAGNADFGGVKVEDLVVGTGDVAADGKTLTVHYSGMFEDGKEFDSSYKRDDPFVFQLGTGSVIQGWDRGLAGMKVGGKRKLTVPPNLAYGESGAGKVIPPNTTLVFEIELLKVE